jgi:hypothetical protein
MKTLRIFLAVIACALPVLLSSCSREGTQNEQVIQSQPESTATQTDAGNAPDQAGTSEKSVGTPEPSDAEPSDAEATARSPIGPDGSAAAPNVVDRSSSDAARAKGEINFDDLKFDLTKDSPFQEELLTEAIRKLDGTKVKLRGYILPSTLFSETNIAQFVLVRDNQQCCFGPGAALFDCVMVQMVDGKTTDFVTRPVTVEGKFVIDTESYRYPPGYGPNGATHMAVFRIEGEAVQ